MGPGYCLRHPVSNIPRTASPVLIIQTIPNHGRRQTLSYNQNRIIDPAGAGLRKSVLQPQAGQLLHLLATRRTFLSGPILPPRINV